MLNENIRNLRLLSGFTQQELAEKLGTSASAVGMYEQGRRKPSAQMLSRLSSVFGVTVDTLLREGSESIDELIESLRGSLLLSSDVMFNGTPLSQEDIDAVISAMKIGARVALEKIK